MDDVEPNLQAQIAANGPWRSFSRIGGANRSTSHSNSARSFQHADHHWPRGNIVHQPSIKGLALVNAVMPFGQITRNRHQLQPHQLESTPLKAPQHLTNQSTLYAIRFDNN